MPSYIWTLNSSAHQWPGPSLLTAHSWASSHSLVSYYHWTVIWHLPSLSGQSLFSFPPASAGVETSGCRGRWAPRWKEPGSLRDRGGGDCGRLSPGWIVRVAGATYSAWGPVASVKWSTCTHLSIITSLFILTLQLRKLNHAEVKWYTQVLSWDMTWQSSHQTVWPQRAHFTALLMFWW